MVQKKFIFIAILQEFWLQIRVIPCQIIQGMTPLPLRFFSFFHYLYVMLKWSIPENFSPQILTIPKLLRFENLTKMGVPG